MTLCYCKISILGSTIRFTVTLCHKAIAFVLSELPYCDVTVQDGAARAEELETSPQIHSEV